MAWGQGGQCVAVVGGRLHREGIYKYLRLIHLVLQQKLTQHCKEITLQLKNK